MLKWVKKSIRSYNRNLIVPLHCHAEDWEWLNKKLLLLNDYQKEKVATKYCNIYIETLNYEKIEYKKYNLARKKANSYLRNYITKLRKFMKAKTLLEYIITPALDELAFVVKNINGLNSKQFMLAVAAQESHCGEYFRQINGVALGIWQIEPSTNDDLYQNYLCYHQEIDPILSQYYTPLMPCPHIQSPMYNCSIARLCMYRYRDPMPELNDKEGMWQFYKKRYNSSQGKATQNQWNENWERYVKDISF